MVSSNRGRSRPIRYARIALAVMFAMSTMAFTTVASAEWAPVSVQRLTDPDPSIEGLPDGNQDWPSISADGDHVVFESSAKNLAASDDSGYTDVFSCDVTTGETRIVSVASDGTQGDGNSYRPVTSSDGRYVAFRSYAANLVADDTNSNSDIFVHDMVSNETTRVSIATDGTQANGNSDLPAISDNGRYVTFSSYASNLVPNDTNGDNDIFMHDMVSGETTRVSVATDGSQGINDSYDSDISGDGTCVVWRSYASNFVPGDTNGQTDVFLRNLVSGETTMASAASDGTLGDSTSQYPSVNEDGTFVAFQSYASNLVAGDTNGDNDIFVRDMTTGETTRVSEHTNGSQASNHSERPSISADGRYVMFQSHAINLIDDDTNGCEDIFRHDLATGTTIRISVGDDESEGNSTSRYVTTSADGQRLAFTSYASNLVDGDWNSGTDAFVRDVSTSETIRVCRDAAKLDWANDDSSFARVSADGRYVVFHSGAGNLMPGDINRDNDVFCYDRYTSELELISVSTEGEWAYGCSTKPSISSDGRYVVFQSDAENLVADDGNGDADIYLRDREAGTTIRVSKRLPGIAPEDEDGECSTWPQISANGTHITYRSCADDIVPDDNNDMDIFVYTIASAETTRASLNSDYEEADDGSHWPTLSADGRYVAFRSTASNLAPQYPGCCPPQIFVRDMQSGETTIVSVTPDNDASDGGSRWPSLSADGRYVAFQSGATDLVDDDDNGNADIFVRDLQSGETTMVSIATDGTQGDSCSSNPAISGDGRYVVFRSYAENLVDNDTNGNEDVFVHDMTTGETDKVSVSISGIEGDDDCSDAKPSISYDGSVIAFDSEAGNLVDSRVIDTDNDNQIYVYDLNVNDHAPVPVAGPDRFETAVATSERTFPYGADTVVVATGRNWPDALGGAALAGALEGPVLLVDTNSIPTDIADEIVRLGATDAIILGGTAAVSAGVESALNSLLDNVDRIGGADRYETAEMIAAETVALLGGSYDNTCFVATGNNFADALSASPLASAAGWPVYLSGENGVSASTLTAMQAAGVTDAVLLGGEAAVTPDTMVTILAAGITAVRIDGANRYETAAKVAQYGVDTMGLKWDGVAITTGENFPDALTGGAAQGSAGSVMLLSASSALSADTETCLTANKDSIGTVVYLGGTNAVSQTVRDAVSAIID